MRRLRERVAFVPADVRDATSVEALTAAAVKRFGGLDVLCCSAGVGLLKTVAETSDEEYDRVMDTNIALDYAASGIRANCIAPGSIETAMMREFIAGHAESHAVAADIVAMHPVGRAGRPDEVAAAAMFLASDDASFVTGVSLAVGGALLAR